MMCVVDIPKDFTVIFGRRVQTLKCSNIMFRLYFNMELLGTRTL